MHDIRCPLKKQIPIKLSNGNVEAFDVIYEKLPLFCYGCGMLGHGERDCLDGPYDEDSLVFGAWLKASPWKPVRLETRQGGSCKARNLNEEFDEDARKKEREDVSKLVDKLQAIALSLKVKRRNGDGVEETRDLGKVIQNSLKLGEAGGGSENPGDTPMVRSEKGMVGDDLEQENVATEECQMVEVLGMNLTEKENIKCSLVHDNKNGKEALRKGAEGRVFKSYVGKNKRSALTIRVEEQMQGGSGKALCVNGGGHILKRQRGEEKEIEEEPTKRAKPNSSDVMDITAEVGIPQPRREQ